MLLLLIGLLYLPINLIIIIRHKINKAVQRVSRQKVVTTTISLLVFFGIINVNYSIQSEVITSSNNYIKK